MKTYKYPLSYDTLNADQKLIFDMIRYGLDNRQNYFLTGNAGVGKSYVIDVYNDFCNLNNINIAKTAPTGTAAINIKGVTLHKLFKLPFTIATTELSSTQICNIDNMIKYLDVIFIDEVSMVRIDIFDNIMTQIKFANKEREKINLEPIQIILSGDFGQLKPVITEQDKTLYSEIYNTDINDGQCFRSKFWFDFEFKPLELTTQMRQSDTNFCNALNNIRIGIKSDIDYINQNSATIPINNGIWVCGYKNTVAEKNALGIFNLPGELYRSKAVVSGVAKIEHSNVPDELLFKINARVMMTQNTRDYHNGSLGTITNYDGRYVTIQLDSGCTVIVEKTKTSFYKYEKDYNNRIAAVEVGRITQFPFRIGYATTIHKAQGQTYDAMNLVPEIFTPGQLYTALSRCKNLDKIYIQPDRKNQKITENKIMQSPELLKFIIQQNSEFQQFKHEYLCNFGD